MTTVLERPIVFDSLLATVAAVEDLSPHLRRVTFVAPRIAEVVTAGPDQRIKVLLAPPDGSAIRLPSGPEWYTEWCAQPVDERFIMRTYTVRALRPEVAELDIEFVLHGVNGPASAWVSEAELGDQVGLIAAVRGRHHQHEGPAAFWRRLRAAGDQRAPASWSPTRRRCLHWPGSWSSCRPQYRPRSSSPYPTCCDIRAAAERGRGHHLDHRTARLTRSRCRGLKARRCRSTSTTPGWPASRR